VINLSADKDRVLQEAFRVLRPGGRFAVSDVVTRGQIPENLRNNALLWIGCIAGALDENDYRAKLAAAGFEQIGIEPTRVYNVEDAREFLLEKGIDVDAIAPQIDGKFMSAFVRATKPASARNARPRPAQASAAVDLLHRMLTPAAWRMQMPYSKAKPDAGARPERTGVKRISLEGRSIIARCAWGSWAACSPTSSSPPFSPRS
jgi:Methylase involved in ubiquinone/menaquinone biosynthesis